jgi:hypothetical protein
MQLYPNLVGRPPKIRASLLQLLLQGLFGFFSAHGFLLEGLT